MVRKIFGELSAQEFVSVQPMNLPSGLIFYLDFKYGTAQAGFTSGTEVFGKTSGSGDPTDGLYGAGKFAYSSNDFSTSTLTTSSANVAAGSTTYQTGSVTLDDIDFEPDLSASVATGNRTDNGLSKLTVAVSSMTNPDLEGIRAFEVSGSGFDEYFPAYTSLNAAETEISFIVRNSITGDVVNAVGAVVNYHKQPTDVTRGDFEATDTQIRR